MMNPAFTIVQQQAAPVRPRMPLEYNGIPFLVLGSIQVTGGILAIILQSILIAMDPVLGPPGTGIWIGVLFCLVGAIGIAAGKNKNRGWIITYMVLTIVFVSLFAAGLLILESIALEIYQNDDAFYQHAYFAGYISYKYYIHLAYDGYCAYDNYSDDYKESWRSSSYGNSWGSSYYTTTTTTTTTTLPWNVNNVQMNYGGARACHGILLLVALVELITLIIGAAFTCGVMCCGNGSRSRGQVIQMNNMQPGQAYTAQQGQAYPWQQGSMYPIQQGQAYPAQPGQAYPAQPGQMYPVQSGPAHQGHVNPMMDQQQAGHQKSMPASRKQTNNVYQELVHDIPNAPSAPVRSGSDNLAAVHQPPPYSP